MRRPVVAGIWDGQGHTREKGDGNCFGRDRAKRFPSPFWITGQRLTDFLALTKPRLNLLVVVTAGVGYYLGAGDSLNLSRLIEAVVGIALVAGGAAGLNQVYERDTDSLMWRTRTRPLAANRITAADAMIFSLALAMIGLGLLAASSNLRRYFWRW